MKIDKKMGEYLLDLLECETLDVHKRHNKGSISEAKSNEELCRIEKAKKVLGVTPHTITKFKQGIEIQKIRKFRFPFFFTLL